YFVYSIIFSFWDSTNQEFWIPQSIFMWLSLAIITNEVLNTRLLKTILIILVLVLFFINWFFCIRLTNNINNDYYYQETIKIQKIYYNANVVLFLNKPWIIGDYLDRYSKLISYQIKEHPSNRNEINPNNSKINILAQLSLRKSILVDFDSTYSTKKENILKTKYYYIKFSTDSFSIIKNRFYNKDWFLIKKKDL
ncbi:MAG: hypothetical protein M1419_10505, partial [Bacteroidetes bacterium]|nr:hypothetical protein [Bacteroidota bacterium]